MMSRLRHLALAVLALLPSVLLAAPPPAATRVAINLAGIRDWNTELPFVDLAKMCRAWVSQREGSGWGKGPTLDVDARGWVKRLEPDCFAEIPFFTFEKGHKPVGDYVCLYEGQGRIRFKGGPVEIMVDLCNRQKTDGWFCMPHLADDEYVRHFARVVTDASPGAQHA